MHAQLLSQRLLGSEWDFPERSDCPKISYMIAAAQRSGSTLLCSLLWQTGVLGAPWEYFNVKQMADLRTRFETFQDEPYVARLQALRSSSNGVFGYKIFYDHLIYLVGRFPGVADFVQSTRNVVFLHRRNVVAQAISLVRANQTGQWEKGAPTTGAHSYDEMRIDSAMQYLAWQNEKWGVWCEAKGIRPIDVYYEDLVQRPADVVATIAAGLGVSAPDAAAIRLPPVESQSDADSAIWERQYRVGTANLSSASLPAHFRRFDYLAEYESRARGGVMP